MAESKHASTPLPNTIFEAVVQAAPVAIVGVDGHGRICLCNRQAEQVTGYLRTALVGQAVELLVPDGFQANHVRDRQRFAEAPRQRSMGDGRPLFLRRRDGTAVPVEIGLAPVDTDIGPLVLASIVDVTGREESNALLRAHARLASLRADLGDILGRSAPLSEVLQQASAALVAHLGVAFFRIWTLNEIDDVLELEASAGLYTHRDGAHARVPVGQFKIGRIAARRAPHLTNDVAHDPEISDPAWAERTGMVAFAGYPLLAGTRLVGVMATFAQHALAPIVLEDLAAVADVVAQCIERRRTEGALRASEQRLRLMIEHAQHGLWEWDIATGREHLDDRWYAIHGYAPGEVPATYRVWEESVHPDDRSRVMEVLQQHLANPTVLYDVDYRARTKQGHWVWINTRGRTHEFDTSGKPLRMMGTIHDITARKAAEAERQRLETQIQQTQRLESLGVLAGGIAHDFNNLLMAILGHASLAQDGLHATEPRARSLHAIEGAARRAAELTQQMLAYAGKTPTVRTVVGLDRLVQEMAALLGPIVSKKADLRFDLSPVAIEADLGQMRQVVMNLMTNASEALGDRAGIVAVRTGVREVTTTELQSPFVPDDLPAGSYAVLEVEDTGTGMDDATLRRVFEPFFTTKFMGRGLGLAAVLGIIRGHRGTVAVTSAVGRGTRFSVFLPAIDRVRAAETLAPPTAARGGQKTVLVVDDEAMIRGYLQSALERGGYRVLEAIDGAHALKVFDTHRAEIAIIVLDLTMPEMDGAEVLRELRRRSADVPVLAMSGFASAAASLRFGDADPSDFVQKPVGVRDLLERVGRLLGRARSGE